MVVDVGDIFEASRCSYTRGVMLYFARRWNQISRQFRESFLMKSRNLERVEKSTQMQVLPPYLRSVRVKFPNSNFVWKYVHVTCPQDKVGGMIMIVIDEESVVRPLHDGSSRTSSSSTAPVQPTPVMVQQPLQLWLNNLLLLWLNNLLLLWSTTASDYGAAIHAIYGTSASRARRSEPVMVRQTVRTLRPDDLLNGPTGGVSELQRSIVTILRMGRERSVWCCVCNVGANFVLLVRSFLYLSRHSQNLSHTGHVSYGAGILCLYES